MSKVSGNGRWVTINGNHVFIQEGESVKDAFKRMGSKKRKKLGRNETDEYKAKKKEIAEVEKNLSEMSKDSTVTQEEITNMRNYRNELKSEISTMSPYKDKKSVDTNNVTDAKTQSELNDKLSKQGLKLDSAYQRAAAGEEVIMYDKNGDAYTGTFNKYSDGGREIVNIKKSEQHDSVPASFMAEKLHRPDSSSMADYYNKKSAKGLANVQTEEAKKSGLDFSSKGVESFKGQKAPNTLPRVSDNEARQNKQIEYQGQKYSTQPVVDWDKEKNSEYVAGHMYVPVDPPSLNSHSSFFKAHDDTLWQSGSAYFRSKMDAEYERQKQKAQDKKAIKEASRLGTEQMKVSARAVRKQKEKEQYTEKTKPLNKTSAVNMIRSWNAEDGVGKLPLPTALSIYNYLTAQGEINITAAMIEKYFATRSRR